MNSTVGDSANVTALKDRTSSVDNGAIVHPNNKLTSASILEHLKNVKEWIAVLMFFAAGGAYFIHYFATREQLDELECSSTFNVLLLRSSSNANFNQQILKESMSEKRNTKKILDAKKESKEPRDSKAQDEITYLELKLQDLDTQILAFQNAIEKSKKDSERAFDILNNNVCKIKDDRISVLQQLREGKF